MGWITPHARASGATSASCARRTSNAKKSLLSKPRVAPEPSTGAGDSDPARVGMELSYIEQFGDLVRRTLTVMERLKTLQSEYEEIKRKLDFPLNIEDFQTQRARRESVLMEARNLAHSLNIAGDQWFSIR
jgi:hypothetical protein